jgi:hypothetical protein
MDSRRQCRLAGSDGLESISGAANPILLIQLNWQITAFGVRLLPAQSVDIVKSIVA